MTYDVTLKVLFVLAPLKRPLINTLKILAPLRLFITGFFEVSHQPLNF